MKELPKRFSSLNSPWCWWWTFPAEGREYDGAGHVVKASSMEGIIWKRRYELAAWRYELCRRHARELLQDGAWPRWDKLTEEEWLQYVELLGNTKLSVVTGDNLQQDCRLVQAPEDLERLGEVWFDRRASDNSLATDFLFLIRKRTAAPEGQTIPSPKRPWRWVEILDLNSYGGSLSKHERSIFPEAQDAAKQAHAAISDAFGGADMGSEP
ncbi:MAG TPA: hypothetical protein VKY92_22160 [Verrucomicrobiae bacterium]|nr:hypothetical protein [Verrucomicrobiae bacterium]